MSDTVEIDEEIRAARAALEEMPLDHHDRATYLDILAVALGERYSTEGGVADLEEALRLSREAVDITPADSPDMCGFLSNYGIRLAEMYSLREEIADLEDAIHIMRQVLDTTPSDDPDSAMYLNNLGTALGDRYIRTNRVADLDESIQITQQAIDAAVDGYSDLPMYLNSLSLRLGSRYEREGDVADLEAALRVIRNAISLTPEDSPDRATYLHSLSIQLGREYSRAAAMPVLEESIQVAQKAVDSSAQHHPDRPMYLNTLGLALGDRCAATNADFDVENAMLALREALDLTPEDSPWRATYLSNLGTQFERRYSKTGLAADLNEAVRLMQDAVRRTPKDHPDLAKSLNSLGICLSRSYLRTLNAADLEEAIRVSQEAVNITTQTTEKIAYLCSLGNRLGERYMRTGATADINSAIETMRQAISMAPATDVTQRAMCLNNLGNRLGDRYDAEGIAAYLDESIDTLQQAVDITPENHPDKASYLNGLGARLATRHASYIAMTDLESAIDVMRRAAEITPRTNLSRALILHNLGAALGDRYFRMKKAADLDEAIRVTREAVDIIPAYHPVRAMCLNGLTIWLGKRSGSKGTVISDLEDSVKAAREAVRIIPNKHASRPTYLNALGFRLLERYKYREAQGTADLDEAIRVLQEAVDATPDSNPIKARFQYNLGTGFDYRNEATGVVADHEAALSNFQSALREPNSHIVDRIMAGIAVLQICATTSDWEQAFEASKIAVPLVPKLTPRSLQNVDKQHLLGQIGRMAPNAAAAALQAGRGPTTALQLLEQGRAVLATSLEEMRTDVSELEARNPELAKQFVRLRDELDQPIMRNTFLQDEHGESCQQFRASQRREMGDKFDQLIGEIRRQPGLEDFLAAPSEADMRAAARCGPIIVINTSEYYRCDAILVEHHQIRSVALPGFKSKDIRERTRNSNLGSAETLEWLWDTVAGPVLDALGLTQQPSTEDWPRIWWVATGTASKLPLHAAGRYYANGSGGTDNVLDRAMSSYSSSVRAIIQGRRRRRHDDRDAAISAPARVLLVAIEHTPGQSRLPFAVREIQVIRSLARSLHLKPIEPGRHKQDIMAHLPQSKVFHFAGHGHTDEDDPSRSHLLLGGGKKDALTVANLLETNLREHSPFLAYLSACGTGRTKNEKFVDESIHLISACQLAGFRHVIGTLWEVNDQLCVDMARITYEGMRDGGMTDESVCRGLHNATRQLRRRWLDTTTMPIRAAGRGNNSSATRNMAEEETHGTSGSDEGDRKRRRLLRDVFACDDDEKSGPLLWVPYVHFGV
ncbi:CHAT domain-containing protein [Podospora didyma]|uniref:CHAT domain-containing protein n=1 Tax=Podospora didyma TaxID=330526 RepID=A0AAE0K632_9PEZI|nr:CHAT domain-containing protein [Podospora didyma]